MAKRYRYTWIVIRDDMKEGDCKGVNNGWDSTTSRCYDLMGFDGSKTGTFGGVEDLKDMWSTYNMRPMDTMRNAAECWVSSNAQPKGPEHPVDAFSAKGLPKCFFHHTVLKGSWSKSKKGIIKMDGGWPGQSGKNDQIWPPIKAGHTCPKGMLFGMCR